MILATFILAFILKFSFLIWLSFQIFWLSLYEQFFGKILKYNVTERPYVVKPFRIFYQMCNLVTFDKVNINLSLNCKYLFGRPDEKGQCFFFLLVVKLWPDPVNCTEPVEEQIRYRIIWKTLWPVLQHDLEYKARKLPKTSPRYTFMNILNLKPRV